ncbi:hypothetical protein OF83DRAFT_1173547 [Amylostereum chailletii]|nr:hypothetical protein OF83DRAFT_1173547 [Amylostereum chailletii]
MLNALTAALSDLTLAENHANISYTQAFSFAPTEDSQLPHSDAILPADLPVHGKGKSVSGRKAKSSHGKSRGPSYMERDPLSLRNRMNQLVRIKEKISQAKVRLHAIAARWEQLQVIRDSDFTCPVCLDVMMRPTLVPQCNHTFCFHCLYELMDDDEEGFIAQGGSRYACPICQGSYTTAPTQVLLLDGLLHNTSSIVGPPEYPSCANSAGSFDELFLD